MTLIPAKKCTSLFSFHQFYYFLLLSINLVLRISLIMQCIFYYINTCPSVNHHCTWRSLRKAGLARRNIVRLKKSVCVISVSSSRSLIRLWSSALLIKLQYSICFVSDSAFVTDYVPKEEVRHVLSRYLSELTLTGEDSLELCLPDGNIPDGFHLIHKRCSRRSLYSIRPGFAIILSEENTWTSDGTTEESKTSVTIYEYYMVLRIDLLLGGWVELFWDSFCPSLHNYRYLSWEEKIK